MIVSVDIGPPAEQKLDDLCVSLAGGNVERGPPVEVDVVDINSFVQQILDPSRVAAGRHEQQLHRAVQVLRDRQQLLLDRAPPYGIQRRLSAETEPIKGKSPGGSRCRV
ncbi:unnamed protein product [Linum trigynum]|uniref:Uncharacterized protein n=1 Tax=Linum trigynum TaxID=586398 RepID=A0AAV2FDI4_9ROSI